MDGKFLIPLSSEHRKKVEVIGGEIIEINLNLDKEPRTLEVPKSLGDKLKKNKEAQVFFDTLSPSNKKKIVVLLETAKTEDTLNKRLEKIISDLNQKIKP